MAAKEKKGSVKVWELYKDGKPQNKACPKCGLGVFMGKHNNRWHCGKCGYTEFNK